MKQNGSLTQKERQNLIDAGYYDSIYVDYEGDLIVGNTKADLEEKWKKIGLSYNYEISTCIQDIIDKRNYKYEDGKIFDGNSKEVNMDSLIGTAQAICTNKYPEMMYYYKIFNEMGISGVNTDKAYIQNFLENY